MPGEPLTNGAAVADVDAVEPNGPHDHEASPSEPKAAAEAFSWLEAHPIFVIVLVGPQEHPFGIQKDFLCARSLFYKKHFDETEKEDDTTIEHIVRLPDVPVEVFAYAQNFLYTGKVFPSKENLPSYEVLVGVWKLGHRLAVDGLCEATLEAMSESRRITQHIPATPLLVKVWEDTPEGSSIRKLLLSWAAEYMRSSDSRAEFARSLPQEVLSELVVAMSSLDAGFGISASLQVPVKRASVTNDKDDDQPLASKRTRHSDVLPMTLSSALSNPAPVKKLVPRASLPGPKPGRRRSGVMNDHAWTSDQKLVFCSDLLSRMLSGPGFWTRLVGPFKDPVDPEQDGVPDYFEKVTKPMDLSTMRAKMDRNEYADEEAFLADMNQIFNNCYTYWSKKDPMWGACERLQKTFEDRFSKRNSWMSKMMLAEEGL